MTTEPTRAEIDALTGSTMLEFGATWCGYCKAAQPIIASALINHSDVKHIIIDDGQGKRLGRSYIVKLWPTLIFLKNGIEVARLVPPTKSAEITEALELFKL